MQTVKEFYHWFFVQTDWINVLKCYTYVGAAFILVVSVSDTTLFRRMYQQSKEKDIPYIVILFGWFFVLPFIWPLCVLWLLRGVVECLAEKRQK